MWIPTELETQSATCVVFRGKKPATPHDRCDWPGELNITSSTRGALFPLKGTEFSF